MVFKIIIKMTLAFTMMSLTIPSYAYAYMNTFGYIDPGTGSYILQILTAMLVGGIFAIKQFWGRITSFFKK